jgi:hypothetical protein
MSRFHLTKLPNGSADTAPRSAPSSVTRLKTSGSAFAPWLLGCSIPPLLLRSNKLEQTCDEFRADKAVRAPSVKQTFNLDSTLGSRPSTLDCLSRQRPFQTRKVDLSRAVFTGSPQVDNTAWDCSPCPNLGAGRGESAVTDQRLGGAFARSAANLLPGSKVPTTWATTLTVTLTNTSHLVTLPLPTSAASFWRVRVP